MSLEACLSTLLSSFLLFQTGALYALPAFNKIANETSPASSPLNSAWSLSISYMSLVYTVFTIFLGFTFPRKSPDQVVSQVRVLTFLASIIFSAFAFAGHYIMVGSVYYINIIIGAQGVPLAIRKCSIMNIFLRSAL